MIIDKIENISMYKNIPNNVVEFISSLNKDIQLGKHILSDDVYVNVEEYATKSVDIGKFESHKDYIDIQILLSGEEKIYITSKAPLTVLEPYNPTRDIEFYSEDITSYPYVTLDGTNFVMLFPHEAHAPQIALKNPQKVLKVVAKIKV